MGEQNRGFALLIVLWSMVLLALMTTRVTSAGRSELQLAANLRSAARVEAVADGLIYEAIFRLMSGTTNLQAAAVGDRTTPVPGGRGVVRVTSLAGRINPNTASESLLRALLRHLGLSHPAAATLAAAIMDWRTPGNRPRPGGAKAPQYAAAGYPYGPPGSPFETVEELGRVLGMAPDVLARLKPHLSVVYPGIPLPQMADKLVASTLEEAGDGLDGDEAADGPGADGVYARIGVQVTLDDGSAFSRRVDVWAGHGPQQGRYLVLRWDVPADE